MVVFQYMPLGVQFLMIMVSSTDRIEVFIVKNFLSLDMNTKKICHWHRIYLWKQVVIILLHLFLLLSYTDFPAFRRKRRWERKRDKFERAAAIRSRWICQGHCCVRVVAPGQKPRGRGGEADQIRLHHGVHAVLYFNMVLHFSCPKNLVEIYNIVKTC